MAYQRPDHKDVAKAIEKSGPALSGLRPWLNIILREHAVLSVPGKPDIPIYDGFLQGGRLASKLYALTMHFVLKNIAESAPGQCLVTGFADDITFTSKKSLLKPICEKMETDLKSAKAVLNVNKTTITSKIDGLPYTVDKNPKILGASLFPDKTTTSPFERLINTMKKCSKLNDPMIALYLLRILYNSSANYYCRINPPVIMASHIANLNLEMKNCITEILQCSSISDESWDLMRSKIGLGLANYDIVSKAAYAAATVNSALFMKTYLPEFADALDSKLFRNTIYGQAYQESLDLYNQCIAENPAMNLTPNVAKLQSILAGSELEKWQEFLLAQGNEETRAFRLSCSLKGANRWLQVLPTCQEFQINPSVFRFALKRRLGISFIPPNLVCGACIKKDEDNGIIKKAEVFNLNHIYKCRSSLNSILLQSRHKEIVKILVSLANNAMETVHTEQHIFPEALDERMDIVIRQWEQSKMAIDVSVIHVSKLASKTAFGSGIRRIKQKLEKYQCKCLHNGYDFTAAVFEDTGAIDYKLDNEFLPKFCNNIQVKIACQENNGTYNALEFYRNALSVALLKYDGIRIAQLIDNSVLNSTLKNLDKQHDKDFENTIEKDDEIEND
jgi:hypothetical protein